MKRKLQKLEFTNLRDFLLELKTIGIELNRRNISVDDLATDKKSGKFGLESFLELCESGDPEHIKRVLVRFFPEPRVKNLELASKMIPYDAYRPDLLRRLFEESFLGGKLFRKFYQETPFFNFKESLSDIKGIEDAVIMYKKFEEHVDRWKNMLIDDLNESFERYKSALNMIGKIIKNIPRTLIIKMPENLKYFQMKEARTRSYIS